MFTLVVDNEIELRLVDVAGAQRCQELVDQNRECLLPWLPWVDSSKTVDDTLAFIKRSLHDYADGKSMNCWIYYKGQIAGCVGFVKIDHKVKKVEIGYWLASSFWGEGIITRSCRKLIGIAFNDFAMQKVEVHAATDNEKSRAVCKRLGMSQEGIITNSELVNGRILDHVIYGLHNEAV